MNAHRVRIEARLELRRQVPIQLNDVKGTGRFEQRTGERAEAWTDFHQGVAGFRRYRAHDSIDDGIFMQEVLSESPPGAVWWLAHRWAVRPRTDVRAGLRPLTFIQAKLDVRLVANLPKPILQLFVHFPPANLFRSLGALYFFRVVELSAF